MKRRKTPLFSNILIRIASVCFISVCTASLSHAAIVVVDGTDGESITVSHLGSDTVSLAGFGTINRLSITGDNSPVVGRDSATGIVFTNGTAGGNTDAANSSYFYFSSGVFQGGAAPGINYARFDFDGDTIYETVIEFDFGADTVFAGDVITRYVYDDGGAALDIPTAVIALNAVPEPSSALLLGLGALGLAGCRRRTS